MSPVLDAVQSGPNGHGLLATKDIKPGTVIVNNYLLLTLTAKNASPKVPSCWKATDDERDRLIAATLSLNDADFVKLQDLCMQAHNETVPRRFTQENLERGNRKALNKLFYTIARLGERIHFAGAEGEYLSRFELYEKKVTIFESCDPNAEALWDDRAKCFEVRVTKKLREGDMIMYPGMLKNPFQPKTKRLAERGGRKCNCAVCKGTGGDGVPHEEVHVKVGEAMEVIAAFRARFFEPGQIVDLADERVYEKVLAINAVGEEEQTAVLQACRRVEEAMGRWCLMHSSLGSVFEMMYIINHAPVIEHDVKLAQEIDAAAAADVDNRDHEEVGEGDADKNHATANPSTTESEPEDLALTPTTSSSLQQSLESACFSKIEHFNVLATCLGFMHESVKEALVQAWNLSANDEKWRKKLLVMAGNLGWSVRDVGGGKIECIRIEALTKGLDLGGFFRGLSMKDEMGGLRMDGKGAVGGE